MHKEYTLDGWKTWEKENSNILPSRETFSLKA
jgi:hypothetical protein